MFTHLGGPKFYQITISVMVFKKTFLISAKIQDDFLNSEYLKVSSAQLCKELQVCNFTIAGPKICE